MAHQRPPARSVRDLLLPSSAPASPSGRIAAHGPVAESLPYWRQGLPTYVSDFQNFVGQVAELGRILTGASGSAIAFRGEQGTICRARSGEGGPPLGALVDTSSGISKQCLDSGASFCCEDVVTDGRVDPEISRAVGIRAVAVVPIYCDGEVSGILEVFSTTPGTFHDHHLKTLQELANWVGSVANTQSEKPTGGPNSGQFIGQRDIVLLVKMEPAYRAFFRNLVDLASKRSPALVAASSSYRDGWNDVLVASPIPWKRFLESVFLHIMVIGLLAGLSKYYPRELVVSLRPLREARVIYYPFSESFPARESNRPAAHPLKTPPPSTPKFASVRKPGLGAATPVLPPPDVGQAEARPPRLPNSPIVAPPPDFSSGSGLRKINTLRAAVVPPSPDIGGSKARAGRIDSGRFGGTSAGVADLSIVPPPPPVNDHVALTYGANGVVSKTGVAVVPPPPSIENAGVPAGKGPVNSVADGGSQVVPPPPAMPAGGSHEGGGRLNSLTNAVSQVVPPSPSFQGGAGGSSVEGRRVNLLANGGSRVVPPSPAVDGGGNSVGGGRAGWPVRPGAEAVSPPPSAAGAGNSAPGDASVTKDGSIPSIPEADGKARPTFEDVQLRVIGLAWAPPRSSYFSNFEVFIAEEWLNKEHSRFIKLVYVFLPYQTRLSEYGFENLKVRKLRVTRDPTCDESLLEMAGHESDNGPASSNHSDDAFASATPDRNKMLPCYRTTADDYRRAVSRSR